MARTERAVLGLSGSTMDWATVPSIASARIGQVGLEQAVDQDPVPGLPLLPEPARAVGEQLPGGRDPEGVHRVLLLGDEGGRHHVEIPGDPASKKGDQQGDLASRGFMSTSQEGSKKDLV